MNKIIIWIDKKFGKEVALILAVALVAGSIAAHLIIKLAPSLQSIALRISTPLALIVVLFLLIVKLAKKDSE